MSAPDPRGRWMAAAGALVAFATAAVAQPHALTALPLDHPATLLADRLAAEGCAALDISRFRPLPVTWVIDAVARARGQARCDPRVLDRLDALLGPSAAAATGLRAGVRTAIGVTSVGDGEFRPLWRGVRPAGEGTPPLTAAVAGRVSGGPHPRLLAVAELLASSSTRNDPRSRARHFRGTTGTLDFSEAYLAVRTGPVIFTLGRGQEAWFGEGEESLILSAHGPPLDRLAIAARGRRAEARALFARLNDVVLDSARDGFVPRRTFHRALAAHALVWRPVASLQIWAGETALLVSEGGMPDLAYANPLMIFLVTENDSAALEQANRNNLAAFFGARASRGRVTAEAELLVDDIQIDRADRDRIPDQLGWRFAASAALPLRWPSVMALQYRRLDSYTYLRSPYSSVYQRYDEPVGSELGPDADWLGGSVTTWPVNTLRARGSAGWWRRGARRIDERPAPSATGRANEPYPSPGPGGLAQRGGVGALEMHWMGTPVEADARLELAVLDNVNGGSDPRTLLRAQLRVVHRFRHP